MTAPQIQPSDNFSATCMAVAWAIVMSTNSGQAHEADAEKMAQKVYEVYLHLQHGDASAKK